jgi:hypothetical protein
VELRFTRMKVSVIEAGQDILVYCLQEILMCKNKKVSVNIVHKALCIWLRQGDKKNEINDHEILNVANTNRHT